MKIGTIIPAPHDATSLYRAQGPINALMRFTNSFEFIPIRGDFNVSWETFSQLDVLFMQRPYTADDVKVAKFAKDIGLKLWIDWDDDLANIPYSNPCFEMYKKANAASNVRDLVNLSDRITVSTFELAKTYMALDKIIYLIPNAFNDFMFKREFPKPTRDKVVLWRGSSTHEKDLLEVVPYIEELARNFPKWKWLFVGMKPWMLEDKIDKENLLWVPSMDPIAYFQFLNKIDPAIQMVPLSDSQFNKCKSNIAWQEASFCGAVTVAPSYLPEFNVPGVVPYGSPADFYATMQAIMYGDHNDQSNESWEHIKENLLLSKVNQKRIELLRNLGTNEACVLDSKSDDICRAIS